MVAARARRVMSAFMAGLFLSACMTSPVAFATDATTTTDTTDVTEQVEEGLESAVVSLESMIQSIFKNENLSIFITALIVIVITAVVSHLVTKFIKHLSERDIVHLASTSLIVNICRVTVWAIGISVVLSACFGIDVTGIVTALGIGGVALSLGLQDTLSNLIGGLTVSLKGVVKPGDYVTIGGVTGIVQDVDWRQTTIRDFSGATYIIPNSNINTTTVTILPPSRRVRVQISFNNNNGVDLDELRKYMLIAVKNEVGKVAAIDKDPIFRFSQITEYCFEGYVIVWLFTQPAFDIFEVQDAIVRACAPYSRAPQMSKELIVRPRTRGAVKKAEGYEELVSSDAHIADEYMTEENFIKKPEDAASAAQGKTAKAKAKVPEEGAAAADTTKAEGGAEEAPTTTVDATAKTEETAPDPVNE